MMTETMTTSTQRLTTRSRISVRWSTAPADMGYGPGRAPVRLTGAPDYVGSPRTVLDYVRQVRRNVGEGTYIRVEFSHGPVAVQREDLDDVLCDAALR